MESTYGMGSIKVLNCTLGIGFVLLNHTHTRGPSDVKGLVTYQFWGHFSLADIWALMTFHLFLLVTLNLFDPSVLVTFQFW